MRILERNAEKAPAHSSKAAKFKQKVIFALSVFNENPQAKRRKRAPAHSSKAAFLLLNENARAKRRKSSGTLQQGRLFPQIFLPKRNRGSYLMLRIAPCTLPASPCVSTSPTSSPLWVANELSSLGSQKYSFSSRKTPGRVAMHPPRVALRFNFAPNTYLGS